MQNVSPMPIPDDVLAVIGLYEDGDEDCNNALLDHETGLDSTEVEKRRLPS